MTLVVILNAVLAILIVSAIVALHGRAIFADRRERGLGARLAPADRPLRPAAPVAPYAVRRAAVTGAERHEKVAA